MKRNEENAELVSRMSELCDGIRRRGDDTVEIIQILAHAAMQYREAVGMVNGYDTKMRIDARLYRALIPASSGKDAM